MGELVEAEGRTFEIMATVYLPDRMMQGGSSHMFVPEIVIPGADFRELYPETGIRKLYFNVEDQKEREAEELLQSYEKHFGARLLRNLPMFCGKVFAGSASARYFRS